VSTENEARRLAEDCAALREATEGWPTPNRYTDALDNLTRHLGEAQAGIAARDAALSDAEAKLRECKEEIKRYRTENEARPEHFNRMGGNECDSVGDSSSGSFQTTRKGATSMSSTENEARRLDTATAVQVGRETNYLLDEHGRTWVPLRALSDTEAKLREYEEALTKARPYVAEHGPPGTGIETTEESAERSAALLAEIDAALARANKEAE